MISSVLVQLREILLANSRYLDFSNPYLKIFEIFVDWMFSKFVSSEKWYTVELLYIYVSKRLYSFQMRFKFDG